MIPDRFADLASARRRLDRSGAASRSPRLPPRLALGRAGCPGTLAPAAAAQAPAPQPIRSEEPCDSVH